MMTSLPGRFSCLIVGVLVVVSMCCATAWAQRQAGGGGEGLPDAGFGFRTFLVARAGVGDAAFEKYLDDARPEVVQVGFYGPMLHGYGDTPGATKYPMNLPAQGVAENLRIFREINARAHERGLKVVGHFPLGKVIGTWQDKAAFYDFYMNHWDEALLGPKPHADVLQVVQRDGQGLPLEQGRDARTTYVGLCLSSPHTMKMLKQMLKVGIDNGVDGYMTWFNYRWDCVCEHCQRELRAYLKERFTAAELKQRFGIENIQTHVFERIAASIPGYPGSDATALDWEVKRWAAVHFKAKFDELFIEYGRSLKPDLIIGTWNHIGHVGHVEERSFLPLELWGRGEDYFWYSSGAAYVGQNYSQREGKVGDAWLLGHYINELSGHKPFVVGKYDRVRPRVNIAEAAALGGGGMGLYMEFHLPVANERLVQYTQFIHKKRRLYDNAKPVGEVGLVLPRQSVMAGKPEALDTFRAAGEALVRDQVLMDVIVDEKLAQRETIQRLSQYAAIIVPEALCLSHQQRMMLMRFAEAGRPVLIMGKINTHDEKGVLLYAMMTEALGKLANFRVIDREDVAGMQAWLREVAGGRISRVNGAWTLRASAYDTAGARVLHLVNYAYDQEKFESLGRRVGPEGELPVPAKKVAVELKLPGERKIEKVLLHDPEKAGATELAYEYAGDSVSFEVDEVNVYALVEVRYAAEE